MNGEIIINNPDAPWCWYIYLQNWVIFRAHAGKYSSTMEHLGNMVMPHIKSNPFLGCAL
jgi:hypothetical protein